MSRYYLLSREKELKAIESLKSALWAIANMQIQETTDKAETLALCMSIARIELAKQEMREGEK